MRDETVCFNSLSVQEETNTFNFQPLDNENSKLSTFQDSKRIINYSIHCKNNNQQVQIIDTNGQIIQLITPKIDLFDVKQSIEVDITNLNKGVYFVRLLSSNGIKSTKLLII